MKLLHAFIVFNTPFSKPNSRLLFGVKVNLYLSITSKHSTGIFLPLQSYSKKTLRENVPKSARPWRTSHDLNWRKQNIQAKKVYEVAACFYCF